MRLARIDLSEKHHKAPGKNLLILYLGVFLFEVLIENF